MERSTVNQLTFCLLSWIRLHIFLCYATFFYFVRIFSSQKITGNYLTEAYHQRRMGWLWWCRPPAPESRSTWQFATSPRSCSCCSSGAVPPLRRCPFSHDEVLRETWVWEKKMRVFHFFSTRTDDLLRPERRPQGQVPSECRWCFSKAALCLTIIKQQQKQVPAGL